MWLYWFHCLCPCSEAGLPHREPFLGTATAAAASKGQTANAWLRVIERDRYQSTCFLITRGCQDAGLAANSRSLLCLAPSLPGQALGKGAAGRGVKTGLVLYHSGCVCTVPGPTPPPCSRGEAVSQRKRSLMFVQPFNCCDLPSEALPSKETQKNNTPHSAYRLANT